LLAFQVDVIVNSAPEHLNLGTGDKTITQSISIAAGAKAQTCLENVRRPVKVGDVIKGDAGTLACKAVFHAVLQHYDPDNKPLSLEVQYN
jgi:O-acetyl-ADP-ribose deacetylase (regulator of RNase III)